jgi:hypothetical protein
MAELKRTECTPLTLVVGRAGYAPTDYPTEVEWRARHLLEHSSAARCPTAAYHLAGECNLKSALKMRGRRPQVNGLAFEHSLRKGWGKRKEEPFDTAVSC